MAEEIKTNSNQTKDTKAKTQSDTTTKAKASLDTTANGQSTAGQADKALALSVQPRSMLPENRPIEPSHLQIVHTYSSVGSDRPVSKGTVEFSSTLAISGNRPIAASTLQVSETFIMGNRPVASNESDETATLLEYLD